jgi:hypothetical protein
VEVETGLRTLCKRYNLTREAIWKIRKFLGHPTWVRNRHYFTKQERHQLDDYFVAVTAKWGLRMSRADYEREILDKPNYSLNDWLLENEGTDFNQYVESKGQTWLARRLDN